MRWFMRRATPAWPRRSSARRRPAIASASVRHGARAHRRDAHRPASRVVVHHARVAACCATIPRRRTQEYARIARRWRSRDARRDSRSTPTTTSPRPTSPPASRPKVAILREQGVNGQVEMAAAFDSRRFRCVRRAHERPRGRPSLAREFKGFVGRGGFSYGDVLGAGEGWAKSILFNPSVRDEFAAFFARQDVFGARRVQRLPDDGQSARHDSGRRALAALHAQQVRAVRRRAA